MAAAGQALAQAAVSAGSGMFGIKRQYKYNKKMAALQNKYNRQNAQWLYDKNLELTKFQLDYDSPQKQMERFKAAGLNPNLIYGSGTPGNMGAPMKMDLPPAASAQPPDVQGPIQAAFGPIMEQMARFKLMNSQANLTNSKIDESTVKQDLMRSQKALVDANPHLNKAYMDSFVSTMESVASMKKNELNFQPINQSWSITKIAKDVELLSQRVGLNDADLAVKAEILKSKQFENALNDLKMKWIKDGEIDADSVRFGTLMLMDKFK